MPNEEELANAMGEDLMMNWTAISDNPVSEEVKSALRAELFSRRQRTTGSTQFLRNFVTGMSVLDIGVVEHDASHFESPDWKHGKIRNWSSHVLGVDIIPEAVALLSARGFNVLEVDATSERDLGERFDRVVIGDVIEHVNRPVDLLRFAARHLAPGGRILVSTPNPYWVVFIWQTLRSGTCITNADHVSWMSPSAALEVGRRAGLTLDEYWLLQGDEAPARRLARRLVNKLFPNSEMFSSKFFYIYTK
jgi:SAM-dependent methyltransferase